MRRLTRGPLFALTSRSWLLAALVLATGCSKSATTSPTPPPGANVPYMQTDLRVGTGADAVNGRFLTVFYTGWLYDAAQTDRKGQQFDSNTTTGFGFTLGAGRVIRGWDIGVLGMKVGGLRRLIIPPDLAYGAAGSGPVPPNATLVFDVELTNVQ